MASSRIVTIFRKAVYTIAKARLSRRATEDPGRTYVSPYVPGAPVCRRPPYRESPKRFFLPDTTVSRITGPAEMRVAPGDDIDAFSPATLGITKIG